MQNCQLEMKKAVEAGYWHMYRYNPTLESGKLTIDSKAPTGDYQAFIKSENRYARLAQSNPERAEALFNKAQDTAAAKYERLLKMQKLYE
jgi:pyruvate-ferredoxin/flavodoxin oxidoreductase